MPEATALRAALPDEPARERIEHDLAATLFVEAGAGSGKTTALVARVLALVRSGVAIDEVAAITFTEKAGAELRDRIRDQLEQRIAEREGRLEALPLQAALERLDGAAIGTLHAFAQRLLAEHPVEVGLPPRVEVLDELTSGIEFERRWGRFLDDLLADPAMERTLLLLLGAGVPDRALRALALAFDRNWDLVEERVPTSAPEPPDVAPLAQAWLAEAERVCAHHESCRDPEDLLAVRLREVADRLAHVRTIADEADLLAALDPDRLPKFRFSYGRKGNWSDKDGVVRELRELGEALEALRADVTDAVAHHLGVAIRTFTLDAARERRDAGRLEFHDLLVLARALLRQPEHGAAVRSHLHERYRHLLLDEFQDTDPIQIELAVRLAAAHPEGDDAGRAPWSEVPVRPGHLFVVGDPKQSIYRFRRADIATFLAARERFAPEAGGVVSLTANFRTAGSVVAVVNEVFARLMPPEQEPPPEAIALGMGDPAPGTGPASRPTYTPLDATRDDPTVGPPVSVVGRGALPKGSGAEVLRAAEAEGVARAVATIVRDGWTVHDPAGGGWRPARLGDIAILVPARTSLPYLEAALDAAGIGHRAEASSLVYASRAVRDLLLVLRAVDDPTNAGWVVAALRTPLLGIGDDDLFRFKVERKGQWHPHARQPDTVPEDDPVRLALGYLRTLGEERHWRSPAELAERVARDLRAFELGSAEGRPRDTWRRLRFVIDQARAWGEATHGELRDYLRWVSLQTAEGARVAEAVLPETDDDAVRILTIHAAKGLEFPVTIVSGMSTQPNSQRAPAEVVFPPGGDVGYRFHGKVATEEFKAWQPIDEQMGLDERIRLLYVATTRARDHLVLSLQRKDWATPPKPTRRSNAELLVEGLGATLDELPDAALLPDDEGGEGGAARLTVAPPPPPSAPQPFEVWAAARDAALAAATRPGAIAATALTAEGAPDVEAPDVEAPDAEAPDAGGQPLGEVPTPDPGLQKRPRDLDLPPWLKGRYGTAVGRAVHGVLQVVDLASGADVDAAVAAQAQAEAVPDRAGDVRALVLAALGSPTVARAATRPHWRELYACTPIGDRLLEGYVDLLYRDDDGLVVVDYKTSSTDHPDVLDARVAGYRLQGAAYAAVVGAATGEPVSRVVFVFLTPRGAVERELPDVPAAADEVRALVAAGHAVLVDDATT